MIKQCKTCDYSSRDELGDTYCVNDDSDGCCNHVSDDEVCDYWQNYQEEFWGDEE